VIAAQVHAAGSRHGFDGAAFLLSTGLMAAAADRRARDADA
jgi:hypothetical protein